MKTLVRLAAVILMATALIPHTVIAEGMSTAEKAAIFASFVLYEIFVASSGKERRRMAVHDPKVQDQTVKS